MARKLRLQYPGAIYHVMNRGDRREPIFSDDDDRILFLETLGEACEKTDWQIHAFCLMHNHFHLITETPGGNLVEGMRWFLGVYTSRFNHRQKEFGHLFSGRYKALMVDGSGSGYLKNVCDYVHLNPVRAGLIVGPQPLHTYAWSSYPLYLEEKSRRPMWLRVDRLLGEWGIPHDTQSGREQFAAWMEVRRHVEAGEDFDAVRQGWYLGSEQFRQELLAQVNELADSAHVGPELRESAQAKAEKILGDELGKLNWTANELQQRRKGHPEKVRIAARLRRETTMTLAWIAEHLFMGAPTHVACLLHRKNRSEQNSENTLF